MEHNKDSENCLIACNRISRCGFDVVVLRTSDAAVAWLAHKQKAAELDLQGIRAQKLCSFADYVNIEKMKIGMLPDG